MRELGQHPASLVVARHHTAVGAQADANRELQRADAADRDGDAHDGAAGEDRIDADREVVAPDTVGVQLAGDADRQVPVQLCAAGDRVGVDR